MSRTGITSAPFLRGRSGSGNIKAWRGRAGWKEAQALKLKMKPKKKVSKKEKKVSKTAMKAGWRASDSKGFAGFTLPKARARAPWEGRAGAGAAKPAMFIQLKSAKDAALVGGAGAGGWELGKKVSKKKKISKKATGGFISVSDYVEDII